MLPWTNISAFWPDKISIVNSLVLRYHRFQFTKFMGVAVMQYSIYYILYSESLAAPFPTTLSGK